MYIIAQNLRENNVYNVSYRISAIRLNMREAVKNKQWSRGGSDCE